ncbi:hypothetical protein D3C81_1487160 [compost metagenome]
MLDQFQDGVITPKPLLNIVFRLGRHARVGDQASQCAGLVGATAEAQNIELVTGAKCLRDEVIAAQDARLHAKAETGPQHGTFDAAHTFDIDGAGLRIASIEHRIKDPAYIGPGGAIIARSIQKDKNVFCHGGIARKHFFRHHWVDVLAAGGSAGGQQRRQARRQHTPYHAPQ